MSFVPGLIVGALAGAAVALLTTPRTGRENREALLTHIPEAPEEAPRLVERARAEIKQRLDAGREAFDQGREETRREMTAELEEARRREGAKPIEP
jgi:gas vesicle protein